MATAGAALADAFVEASLAEMPGGKVTMAKIGGRPVRILGWPDDPIRIDVTVLVTGDVVLIASASPSSSGLVTDALTRMFQPKLDALLPATLGGQPLERMSMPAAAFGTGGDMCTIVCPGEPQALAAKLGADITHVDVAIALLRVAPGVVIVAMRFPGIPTDRLVAARIAVSTRAGFGPPAITQLKVAGKKITHASYSPFAELGADEYLYAHDHVLYMVHVDPNSGTLPALGTAAFRALP